MRTQGYTAKDEYVGRFNDKLFYGLLIVCTFLFLGLMFVIFFRTDNSTTPPYALKQNGDTLFIPTQVIIKHDTLVVIQTSERRPVQDSISEITGWSTGGTFVSGGWISDPNWNTLPSKRPYKQRDTIYEHKVIYY